MPLPSPLPLLPIGRLLTDTLSAGLTVFRGRVTGVASVVGEEGLCDVAIVVAVVVAVSVDTSFTTGSTTVVRGVDIAGLWFGLGFEVLAGSAAGSDLPSATLARGLEAKKLLEGRFFGGIRVYTAFAS